MVHWADMTADRIIRQCGDKDSYTLASGITPSGTVHFGNFREVITVDLIARGLRARGKNVRFIFSWDDYDTFRKIPANMPKQDELKKFMFKPIVDTPDPYGEHDSYAAHHEKNFEEQLEKMGVVVEPLYQAKKYRAMEYNKLIKTALLKKDMIKDILDRERKEPLPDSWLPLSIYCENCNTDRIKSMSFDGEDSLNYECENCGHKGSESLESSKRLKLPWRIDWPMRWSFEEVEFEPGGKDHSSQGGSFSTAKEIVSQVFDFKPPIYLQYDFVSIKGRGGKMSSSSGDVVTVNDVLKVYEPEMVRWIFASYKTNVEFSVSFDLDVIKVYEDWDRTERIAYGEEEASEKKVAMAKRVYELSQINGEPSDKMPFQPSFRHLSNILQIYDKDIERSKQFFTSDIQNARDERRFYERSERAIFWLENFAPEDFKFTINKEKQNIDLESKEREFLSQLVGVLTEEWEQLETDKMLNDRIYEVIHQVEIAPQSAFATIYMQLISKEKGPKLAKFLKLIGKERTLSLLS